MQMKTAFSRNTVKVGRLCLFFCLIACVQSALADTIDRAGAPGVLVVSHTNDLNFPGTPLPDYAFLRGPGIYTSNLSPGDPGFFDLGLNLGSFLVTGNTYFNFTGEQQISIIQLNKAPVPMNAAPGASPPQPVSSFIGVPEPGSGWLLLGAMILSGLSLVNGAFWGRPSPDSR